MWVMQSDFIDCPREEGNQSEFTWCSSKGAWSVLEPRTVASSDAESVEGAGDEGAHGHGGIARQVSAHDPHIRGAV